MSNCATIEQSMDLDGKSAEFVRKQESGHALVMGKMSPAELGPTAAELVVPREESGDAISQLSQKDVLTKGGNLPRRPVANTVILVKEALPAETVAFVDQVITVGGGRVSTDLQTTASTRERNEGTIDSTPSYNRQSVREKSKSTSAVDTLTESPHHRRILARVEGTGAEWADQRHSRRTDEDTKSSETPIAQVVKTRSSRETEIESLQEMDERRDRFSDTGSRRIRTPESARSDTLSYRSTNPSPLFDSRTSTRSQTPDSISSALPSSPTSTNEPSPQSSDSRMSGRYQTPESLSSRSTSQSPFQLPYSTMSSRNQTPESFSARSLSVSSGSTIQPDSRMSIRSQTPDSIISACSQSPRSNNPLPSPLPASRNASRSRTPDSIISARSLSSRSTNQPQPQPSISCRDQSPNSDSDCIVGPFPMFARMPLIDATTRTDSLQSTETISIGSSKNSSVIQSHMDLAGDLSDDSDCIVGPFPLFAPGRPKEVMKITSMGSIGSHSDLEPEIYSSDDSDCIVGPFPLFTPGRPKEITTTTSSRSIESHSDLEPEAYLSDDSDCIVGPFPLFAAGPFEEAKTTAASSPSTDSRKLSPRSFVNSLEGSDDSSDDSNCIVGPFPDICTRNTGRVLFIRVEQF